MKPTKAAATPPRRSTKVPSRQAIIRAVASSIAIDTGRNVREIESALLNKRPGLRKVALAS